MPTILVTGANRGLGLEFARQYAADGWQVIGTVRDLSSAGELKALDGDIRVETLDVSDLEAVTRFPERLDAPIEIFLANAGLYGPRQIATAADGKEWLKALGVLAVSPVLMTVGLMPALEAARGKAVAVTSRMGSVSDNGSGGFIAYRSGKAALNAAWTSLALDHGSSGVAFGLLHPGGVQTRMGGPSAPVEAAESVAGMRRVIAGLEAGGAPPFLDFRGDPVPW